MPVNPTKVYTQNGVLINEFLLDKSNTKIDLPPLRLAATPSGICLYKMPELPLKLTNALAETYVRRTYYGDMGTFVPHWYVDKFAAWKILEAARQGWHAKDFIDNTYKLGVVLCGDSARAQQNTIKLICYLLKEYGLGLNSITYKCDVSDEFKNELCRRSKILNIVEFLPLMDMPQPIIKNVEVAAPVIPTISFEVYTNKKWQQPIKDKPIQAIRINIDKGELQYRTHLLKGGWLDWVTNGEESGHIGTYIDGFQINYQNDDFQLLYCFSTIKGPSVSWRATNFTLPTQKQIDLIDFKIEHK